MKKQMAIAAAVLMISAGTAYSADTAGQEMQGRGMQKGMQKEMQKGMTAPHHRLGMGYRKNLVNFAEALRSEVATTGKVDKQFAGTAVKEMRDSYEKMRTHHEQMPEDMKARMGEKMKMMENRLSMIGQHLDLLEKEVKADVPDPNKVTMEVRQILKQCEMMKMKDMQKKKRMSGT